MYLEYYIGIALIAIVIIMSLIILVKIFYVDIQIFMFGKERIHNHYTQILDYQKRRLGYLTRTNMNDLSTYQIICTEKKIIELTQILNKLDK